MKAKIKMTSVLYREIMTDLARRHPFAAERVGFVFGRIGSLADDSKLVLLTRYHSIPDSHYLKDRTVGARIGGEAITWAMQAVYYGRASREGIFHIHCHEHTGEPGMSGIDRHDLRNLMPGFQSVGRESAHGIIILSRDHGRGWVWLPGRKESIAADTIDIIGAPIAIFRGRIAE
jgi:hypothetical protein